MSLAIFVLKPVLAFYKFFLLFLISNHRQDIRSAVLIPLSTIYLKENNWGKEGNQFHSLKNPRDGTGWEESKWACEINVGNDSFC